MFIRVIWFIWGIVILTGNTSFLSAQLLQDSSQEISSSFRYLPRESLKGQSGNIQISESELDYAYSFKALGRLPVVLSLHTGYLELDHKDINPIFPAHLTSVGAEVETTFPFFGKENMYWRTRLLPAFNTDDWSLRSSAFRLPVQSFLIYQPCEFWTWITGLAVYADYDNEILPILGLIYKPNKSLQVYLIPDDPHIDYALNERLSLYVRAGLINREFEVDKGYLQNVVLRYREYYAGGGLRLNLNPNTQISLGAGYSFNRSLAYIDNYGKAVIKDGSYCEFRICWEQ